MMINESIDCTVCGKKPAKLEQQCKSTRYCSKECQKADWSTHKLLCKQRVELPRRPGENTSRGSYRLSISFPADKPGPVFVWVYCDLMLEDGKAIDSPKMLDFFGNDSAQTCQVINKNLMIGKSLCHELILYYRDTFLIDGSKPNHSVAKAMQPFSHYANTWRGQILLMRESGDITLADLRHAVIHLAAYANSNVFKPETLIGGSDFVRGVVVTCEGDRRIYGALPFVEVAVPTQHPIRKGKWGFSEFYVSTISEMVGMPVRAMKLVGTEWEAGSDPLTGLNDPSNQHACFLFLETDVDDGSWGWAPFYWQTDIGNVLLLREDGKDLTEAEAETLCCFCQDKLQPMFEAAIESGDLARKKRVIRNITRESMEAYKTESINIKKEYEKGVAAMKNVTLAG